jgi:hypothetical protein
MLSIAQHLRTSDRSQGRLDLAFGASKINDLGIQVLLVARKRASSPEVTRMDVEYGARFVRAAWVRGKSMSDGPSQGVNPRTILMGVAFCAAALILVLASMGKLDGTAERAAGAEAPTAEGGGSTSAKNGDADAAPLLRSVSDRRVRDDLRQRILAGWAQSESAPGPRASDPQLRPLRTGADGQIDPQHIKEIVRADLMPMVTKCHDELRARKPGAAGRISLKFKIINDEKLGGVVDDTQLAADAGPLADDERFTTCVTESTMSLAFPPLPQGGSAIVPMSLVFEDRDE